MDLNSLDTLESDIWNRLVRAGADSRSPWRWVALATVSGDNIPHCRTVVTRYADIRKQCIHFYTDLRTVKVENLRENNIISVMAFDRQKMEQLRLSGPAQIHHKNEFSDQILETIPPRGRNDYESAIAPGTAIADSADTGPTPQTAPDTARDNFCVIVATVIQMDWLKLERENHRRAVFTYENGKVAAAWVHP